MATGKEIMTLAGIQLQDEDFVRWTLPELCGWINEGQRAIVLAKPSALSRTRVLALAQGTLQSVPTAAGQPTPLALIDIIRNVATGVDTPRVGGRTVKPVSRTDLDAQNPDWHSTTSVPFNKIVRHFTFDEQNPLEFYVYPGNDGTGFVEALLSLTPTTLVASGPATSINSYSAQLSLPEPYSVPLLDYVLSRCYSKDDTTSVPAKANDHYAKFASAVGLKIQVEGASSPNRRRGAS